MNSSELRIGNKVRFLGIDYDSGGNRFHDPAGDEDVDVDMNHLRNIIGDSDMYEPIPLTEEWLRRFGIIRTVTKMELYGEYIDYRGSRMVLFILPTGKVEVEFQPFEKGDIEKRCYITSIQHVHQLQNLYFALTGEELYLHNGGNKT